MSDTKYQENINAAGRGFNPTSWSLILKASAGESSELAEFCRRYWHPLYAFARRSGSSAEDAQDLSQGFFAYLLERDVLQRADAEKGRFRNFLLTLFKRFMQNEWQRGQAQKRGGDQIKVDYEAAEYSLQDFSELGPDEAYQRAWALTLLENAMAELEERFITRGDSERWGVMKPYLNGDSEASLKEGADILGVSENAFTVAVHRLRRDFSKVLRKLVADTLNDPAEVQEELHFLITLLQK
ncbi:ECF-type sigma factor [Lentisphaera profundi]|uniref:ECF-type sigma factor n=1 Tax=Lentisphaera profundi TaxID=1658616 RepID=A0ABY7VV85_9BACT|nr:ECF-type sigma factor [Lentisphaera profundi]WDE98135.1 ECF-type sigma factor [Lentisphaera profundi]